MMNLITKNYGLLGGTLDCSKHLEAAIPQLCLPGERTQAIEQLKNEIEAQEMKKTGQMN